MISLILTIVGIALVALLAFAALYYGGQALNVSSARASATMLVSQGQQIVGAAKLYYTEHGHPVDSLQTLVDEHYLVAIPVPPSQVQSTALDRLSPISSAYAAEAPAAWTWDASNETLAFVRMVGGSLVCKEVNVLSFKKHEVRNVVDTDLGVQCYGASAPYTVIWNARAKQAADAPIAAGALAGSNSPLCAATVGFGHVPDQCGSGLVSVVPPNPDTATTDAPPVDTGADIPPPILVNPKAAYATPVNSNGTINVELGYGWNVFTVQFPTNVGFYCAGPTNTENQNCIGYGSGPYRTLAGTDWYDPNHTWMGDLWTYTWGPVLYDSNSSMTPWLQCDSAYYYLGDQTLLSGDTRYLTSPFGTPYASVSADMKVTIVCHVPKPFVDYLYGVAQPVEYKRFAASALYAYKDSSWNTGKAIDPTRAYSMDETAYIVPAGRGYQVAGYGIWLTVGNHPGNAGNGAEPSFTPSSSANAGKLTADVASVNFGTVAKWSGEQSKTVTVKNTGTAAVKLLSIVSTDTNNTFPVVEGTCAGLLADAGSLAAGDTCTVVVGSRPAVSGSHSGQIVIRGSSGTTPILLQVGTQIEVGATPPAITSITLNQCWNTAVTFPFPDGVMPSEAGSLNSGTFQIKNASGETVGECGVDAFDMDSFLAGSLQSWSLQWAYTPTSGVWGTFPSSGAYNVSCHVVPGTPSGVYNGLWIGNYIPQNIKTLTVNVGANNGNGGCGNSPQ